MLMISQQYMDNEWFEMRFNNLSILATFKFLKTKYKTHK